MIEHCAGSSVDSGNSNSRCGNKGSVRNSKGNGNGNNCRRVSYAKGRPSKKFNTPTSSSVNPHSSSDVAPQNSSQMKPIPATASSNGPPHYVDLHVHAGECVSLQLLDGQEQVVSGPATITLVSQQHSPPVPIPVQVPPGHMIHQVADENGILKHIILSVMNPKDGCNVSTNVIDFPHESFRVDSLSELVSSNTSLVGVDGDNSMEFSYQQNHNSQVSSDGLNVKLGTDEKSRPIQNSYRPPSYIPASYDSPDSSGIHVDLVHNPRTSSSRDSPMSRQCRETCYKHPEETYTNETDKQGDLSSQKVKNVRDYTASGLNQQTERHQSSNDVHIFSSPDSIVPIDAYDAAPELDQTLMAAPTSMMTSVDGQIYGYPPCCCCCYCDPSENAAVVVAANQSTLSSNALIGQQDVVMMPTIPVQPPLHDNSSSIKSQQMHNGPRNSGRSSTNNNIPVAYHHTLMVTKNTPGKASTSTHHGNTVNNNIQPLFSGQPESQVVGNKSHSVKNRRPNSYKHGRKGHSNNHNSESQHNSYAAIHHYGTQSGYGSGLHHNTQFYQPMDGSSPQSYKSSPQVPPTSGQPYHPTYSNFQGMIHAVNNNTVSNVVALNVDRGYIPNSTSYHANNDIEGPSNRTNRDFNNVNVDVSQQGRRYPQSNDKNTANRYNSSSRSVNSSHLQHAHISGSLGGIISVGRSSRGGKSHQQQHTVHMNHNQVATNGRVSIDKLQNTSNSMINGTDDTNLNSTQNKQSVSKDTPNTMLPADQSMTITSKQQPIVSQNPKTNQIETTCKVDDASKLGPANPKVDVPEPSRQPAHGVKRTGSAISNKNDNAPLDVKQISVVSTTLEPSSQGQTKRSLDEIIKDNKDCSKSNLHSVDDKKSGNVGDIYKHPQDDIEEQQAKSAVGSLKPDKESTEIQNRRSALDCPKTTQEIPDNQQTKNVRESLRRNQDNSSCPSSVELLRNSRVKHKKNHKEDIFRQSLANRAVDLGANKSFARISPDTKYQKSLEMSTSRKVVTQIINENQNLGTLEEPAKLDSSSVNKLSKQASPRRTKTKENADQNKIEKHKTEHSKNSIASPGHSLDSRPDERVSSLRHKTITLSGPCHNNITNATSTRSITTSSHQACSGKHHHGQPIKLTSILRQYRNKVNVNIEKLLQHTFSSYSNTKFASLLLIIFVIFATLLAILIDHYIVAPVTE